MTHAAAELRIPGYTPPQPAPDPLTGPLSWPTDENTLPPVIFNQMVAELKVKNPTHTIHPADAAEGRAGVTVPLAVDDTQELEGVTA